MKYLTLGFLIVGTLCSCLSSSKTKVVNLEFWGEECLEKKVSRIYLNDTVFVQYTCTRLFNEKSTIRIDTFKVIDSYWQIKRSEGYQLYFDEEAFERGDTIFNYSNDGTILLKRIPIRKITEGNSSLYEFKVETQHYNYFAPRSFFDPKIGIVKIDAPTLECEIQQLRLLNTEWLPKRKLSKLYSTMNE